MSGGIWRPRDPERTHASFRSEHHVLKFDLYLDWPPCTTDIGLAPCNSARGRESGSCPAHSQPNVFSPQPALIQHFSSVSASYKYFSDFPPPQTISWHIYIYLSLSISLYCIYLFIFIFMHLPVSVVYSYTHTHCHAHPYYGIYVHICIYIYIYSLCLYMNIYILIYIERVSVCVQIYIYIVSLLYMLRDFRVKQGAGHLSRPPLLLLFDITLKTTS